MKPLHPHQSAALDLLRQSLGKGNRRPLVQAPTGFGKTVLASHVIAGARRKGNRVIFVVPTLSLVDQAVQAFQADGIHEIGVMQGVHEMTDCTLPVQVASIQTLARRRIPDAQLVIVDEAHRFFRFMGKWMADWDAVPFVGLSATPWTKGLGKYYDDLIVAATTEDLIRDGFLSPFRVFAPSKPDLSKCRTVAGDWHEGDLGKTMNQPTLVADIVQTWRERANGLPTLVFAVDRAHAQAIQKDFIGAGINCGYVDCYTDRQERAVLARQFNDGELRVIANVGCLTTGIDWDVRCIVMARPTKSEMLFVQIIGRGLRTANEKTECLILDHSDTHQRLGFVTDIHHDVLHHGKENESGKREKEKPLPKECSQCKYLKPAGVHACPECGFAPQRQSEVDHGAGELAEVKRKTNRVMTSDEKRRFYGELKGIALTRGYSPGWTSHQYRERTGVWPNAYKDAPPIEPSMETLSWVKSRMIRYAKARKTA